MLDVSVDLPTNPNIQLNDPDSPSWPVAPAAVVRPRHRRLRRQDASVPPTTTDKRDLPILESTFSDNIDLGISSFFNVVAGPMDHFAFANKDTPIEEVSLTVPVYGTKGVIRGVKPPRYTRFMQARDVINALYVLIVEELVRVDQQGKMWNAVTSRINAPEDSGKFIGALSLQKASSGAAEEESVPGLEGEDLAGGTVE